MTARKPAPGAIVSVRDRSIPIATSRIRRAALHVLEREGSRARIGIAIVSDVEMARLHDEFLGIDETTDVLTFPLEDEIGPEPLLGEVVACAGVARREARSRGTAAGDELLLYVVHGILHLLGYDDTSPRKFARMHRREAELLAELGIAARVEV